MDDDEETDWRLLNLNFFFFVCFVCFVCFVLLLFLDFYLVKRVAKMQTMQTSEFRKKKDSFVGYFCLVGVFFPYFPDGRGMIIGRF